MVRKSRKSREEWKIYNNVFDQFTTRGIYELSSKGYFKDLKSSLALGKEANVFTAEKDDGDLVIVKIYRLENCNFNKMYSYINADPRFTGLDNQKRKIIFSWVQREFKNLSLARQKCRVPTPIVHKNNILVMSFVGYEDYAAPPLKDAEPENIESFYKEVISQIKNLISTGVVHGDLSEFNILNHDELPVLIDFSQGTSIKAFDAKELLERDMRNVTNYFKKRMKLDVEGEIKAVLDFFEKSINV